jgi:hypothetical protein
MFVAVMRMVVVRVVMFVRTALSAAVRFGGRVLGQKLLPTVFAAKVKRLATAVSMERRCFVHRHSADGVFGHWLVFLIASRW